MKILSKYLGKLTVIGFAMVILYFILILMDRYSNFRDALYEFNKNGIHLYIGSLMVILGLFVCLIYIFKKYISNIFTLYTFIITGIIILTFVIDKWIIFLQILFSNYQLDNFNIIEFQLEFIFENNIKAKNTITIIIIYFFIFNMLLENMEIILKNKPYIKEAFANKNDMTDLSIFGLGIYLFWPAAGFVTSWHLSNFIILITILSVEILYFISNFVIWKRMIKFSISDKKETTFIVVSENGEGHFFHQLFKKEYKFVKQLYHEQIVLIPRNENQCVHEDKKNNISLECYITFFTKENEIQRNHLENAIFHMAYCVEYFCDTEKLDKSFYEKIIVGKSAKEAVKQIIPYCNKVSYKKNMKEKLQSNQYEEKNIFICNYIIANKYLQNEIDTFQVFKMLLNTLEMINCFYNLILISYQEWNILSILQRQKNIFENATFGSWIMLRNFLLGEKQKKRTIQNSVVYNKCEQFKIMMQNEKFDYKLFEHLYHMINKEGQEKKITTIGLSTSFEEIRDFRNSTRGHGVYTFKITDELNLCLMKIVTLWFHILKRNGFLEDDYTNLLHLGWILEYKNKTYFFYSYNKETNELIYHCFLDGTILSLPYDIL